MANDIEMPQSLKDTDSSLPAFAHFLPIECSSLRRSRRMIQFEIMPILGLRGIVQDTNRRPQLRRSALPAASPAV